LQNYEYYGNNIYTIHEQIVIYGLCKSHTRIYVWWQKQDGADYTGNSMSENTPAYNVKVVVKETGLTPATLRAWERRYHLFKPKRSPGGHRLFSEDEISLIKWLVARQKEGLSISRAVDLWRSQANQSPAQFQVTPAAQTIPALGGGMLDQLRQAWREACLAFDEPKAELATAKALAIATPEVVCTQVLQKGLAELGAGWYAGTVTIQQEHFASALVARRLNALFTVTPMPTRPGRLLAACPPGEDHDLALLMLAFILRWRGWEVIYLGADVSLDQLDTTLQVTSPHLVLSVAQTLPGAASLSEFAEFTNARSIPLAYGGGIFNQIPDLAERIPGNFMGRQVDAAPQMVEHLLAYQPSRPASRSLPPVYAAALAECMEKEALIVTRVRQILQPSPIDPRYVEVANTHFTRAIVAALVLGEINYLNYSVEWLNGLLVNYGLSPALSVQYYHAFHQAIKEQPGLQAGPVLEWLARF
jgi:DNA-binding transcriptional MerR regulator